MEAAVDYSKITRHIKVTVQPAYLKDRSIPQDDYFVWAYHVTIENRGMEYVTLRNRHWRITDARGHTEEVQGEGVVGEQPHLRPGDKFEYSSGTPLTTASGIMMGSYEMETDGGEMFDVEIPAFSLDSPHEISPVN